VPVGPEPVPTVRPHSVQASAWTIEQSPLREQSDELIAELYAAKAPLYEEARPEDPRSTLATDIADVRNMPAPEDGLVLVARDGTGEIAGLATCTWEQLEGWSHVLQARIEVLPARRRQGLGRLLLERAAGVAEQRGLRLVMGRTRDNVPAGAAFAARFGAQQAMAAEENRLDLSAVDRDLVGRWLAEGPVRAPGYRLEFVSGRTPPGLAERVAEIQNVMNTAPREDMDVSDTLVTPELVAEFESAAEAVGRGQWTYYAVEEATGRFVGLTGVYLEPGIPDRAFVGDTGVEPAHRGRSLGKWLKAAMTRKILDERPEIRWVITWNAGSNDAMLAINRQLGFRTAAVHTTWQIPVAELRARLAEAEARPGSRHEPATLGRRPEPGVE
jgi:mycothiol synthase